MFNRITIVAAAAVLGVMSAPALATQRSVEVSIADLNLSGEAVRATLETRLARALRKACGARPSARDLSGVSGYRTCQERARESYRDQVRVAVDIAVKANRVAVLTK